MPNRNTLLTILLGALLGVPAFAQVPYTLVGMGDSIGEGVQSADASYRTQPNTYLKLIANQMGVSFPLPLILDGPTTTIESVTGRTRINPNALSANLAVSGASVDSMLNQMAGQPVTTEADLVLEPRTGTQMQIAQSLKAPMTICWIGNNDVLGAILAWNQLDASQMTPLAAFQSDYATITADLKAASAAVVMATIPDVTEIGYVVSPQDLQLFLGNSYGLPQGSFTTVPTMLLIKLGLLPPTILQNPNYVLDPTEIAAIEQRRQQFNQIIKSDAAAAGFAVADIAGLFQQYQQNPPVFDGLALSTRFNGGLFSLDGVHPSDIGHALAANAFIAAANQQYGFKIPPISKANLLKIAEADPFLDWDQDLVVAGRPFAGLLETLGPKVGISGDLNDKPPASAAAASSGSKINPAAGQAFMQQYFALKGLNKTSWTEADAIAAMQDVFSKLL